MSTDTKDTDYATKDDLEAAVRGAFKDILGTKDDDDDGPDLTAGVRDEGGGSEGRDVSARVTKDELAKPEVRDAHTYQMMAAIVRGNVRQAEKYAEKLVRGGHYGEKAARHHQRGQGDFYSTIVDEDGAFNLPTQVRATIEELADQVGVARQIANVFSQAAGEFVIPGGSGAETAMQAVAEGGEITSAKRLFRAIKLNPAKWATIIPWTYEVQVEMGARILQDVNRAIARSSTRAEDAAMLLGDGTSTYNGIDGIFSAQRISDSSNAVGQITLASGSTDPADITPDNLVLARNQLDPGARMGNLAYVFHPDLEAIFLTKKDDNGAYLFDYVTDGDVPRLKGIPVYYTEVLPAEGTSADTDFGVLMNGDYWHMATGQGMTTEEMSTGTVKDADDGTEINLGTRDLRALKVRTFFDMGANFNGAFMKFTTAAS